MQLQLFNLIHTGIVEKQITELSLNITRIVWSARERTMLLTCCKAISSSYSELSRLSKKERDYALKHRINTLSYIYLRYNRCANIYFRAIILHTLCNKNLMYSCYGYATAWLVCKNRKHE